MAPGQCCLAQDASSSTDAAGSLLRPTVWPAPPTMSSSPSAVGTERVERVGESVEMYMPRVTLPGTRNAKQYERWGDSRAKNPPRSRIGMPVANTHRLATTSTSAPELV